jgi:5-formyltetrahydrofolate cyclo-ligase
MVEHVPCADHDHHVHKIVTEKRVIDCPTGCPTPSP